MFVCVRTRLPARLFVCIIYVLEMMRKTLNEVFFGVFVPVTIGILLLSFFCIFLSTPLFLYCAHQAHVKRKRCIIYASEISLCSDSEYRVSVGESEKRQKLFIFDLILNRFCKTRTCRYRGIGLFP